jgi:hypothetical protein
VSPLDIVAHLSPHARVLTAVLPIVGALLLRLFFGKGRLTGVLISVATVWFAANVLLAPYSAAMQQDIENVHSLFR